MIEISAALAGLEASITTARALKALAKKLDSAELQNQAADLLQALAEAKIEGAELKARVWELERAAELEQDLQFDGHVYRKQSEPDDVYCQLCWDKEKLLIRVYATDADYNGQWHCRNCGHYYGEKKHLPTSRPPSPGGWT